MARSVAKQLVGHRTDLMYSRYAITNETDLRDAVAKVVADVSATKPLPRIGRASGTDKARAGSHPLEST